MANAAPQAAGATNASRLCSAEAKTSASQGMALYDTGAGLRLMDVPPADLAAELDGSLAKSGAGDCAFKATAANLSVKFPGQAAALTAGGVSFFNPAKTLDVLDPVLCHSYANGGLTMALGDTNGAVHPVQGWESIRYDLGLRQVIPTALQGDNGPLAYCFSFPYAALVNDPTEFPPAAGNADAIFRGRFESTGDLRVEMLAADTLNTIRRLNVTAGYDFSYKLRVTNVGEGTVAGVAVHEFVPLDAGALVQPVVAAGDWSCERDTGAPCSTPSGTGEILLTGQTLAPGQSLVFDITRSVPAGVPGDQTMLAAAAFVDPSHATGGGEDEYEDNDASLVVKLLDNQPPTIACVDQGQPLANPVAMAEDAAARTVTCTVTDSDEIDTVASFAVVGAATTFGPLQSFATVDGTAGDGSWTFTLTPKADESGIANIVLRAIDDREGARDLGFTVNVASVNDTPSFDVVTAAVDVFSDGSNPDGWSYVDCLAAPGGGFNCEVALSSFFLTFDGGAANESDQSVTPMGLDEFGLLQAANCGVANLGEDVSAFFSKRPEVLPASSKPLSENPTYALRFSYRTTAAGSVFCDFRFSDSGGAVSAPVRVTFTMQDPPAP